MILHASDGHWLLFEDGQAICNISPFPKLHRPAKVVWYPQRGVTGVASLEGNSRHAAVLIERKLRSEGSIEGEVKMFVHQIRPVGQGYQALYTTAPLQEWQRLLAWANAQIEHCLIFLSVSLLWQWCKEGNGVVLHSGRHFMFLCQCDDQIIQINTVAFSDTVQDLQLAAGTLAKRVLEEISEAVGKARVSALRVDWFSILQEPLSDAQVLTSCGRSFHQISSLKVQSCDASYRFAGQTGMVLSGLPALARCTRTRIALNESIHRFLFLADTFLPVCGVLTLTLSLMLVGISVNWLRTSRQTSAQTEQVNFQEADARRKASFLQAAFKVPDEKGLSAQLAFLGAVQRINTGSDVTGVLRALKTASREELQILSVRSEDNPPDKAAVAPKKIDDDAVRRKHTISFLVDGLLSNNVATRDSQFLSSFVRTMRDQGYLAEPVDTKSSAGLTTSSRLVSYRVTHRASQTGAGL